MLKEYKFDPSSVVVTVKEGTGLNVDAKAERVAYSAFGNVISLAGEPEPGVVVEAVGSNGCSQYAEEAVTESNGGFRLRGLLPTCDYVLKVKSSPSGEKVEWTPAEGIPVSVKSKEDVKGLRLIVFRPGTRTTVSVHVHTPSEEALASLRAVVFREDRPDIEITSKKLLPLSKDTSSTLFALPVSLERDTSRKYVLRLESSLPKSMWDYRTPEITFNADRSFRFFNVEFKPNRKSTDQEFKETSVVVLPIMILVAFAVINFNKIWPSIASLIGKATAQGSRSSSGSRADADTGMPDLSWVEGTTAGGAAKKKVKAKRA